jgi:hypothetical protein
MYSNILCVSPSITLTTVSLSVKKLMARLGQLGRLTQVHETRTKSHAKLNQLTHTSKTLYLRSRQCLIYYLKSINTIGKLRELNLLQKSIKKRVNSNAASWMWFEYRFDK